MFIEQIVPSEGTNLYLIRHGETDWNVARKLSGQSNDAQLTNQGMEQAFLAGEDLSAVSFDAIYASDLTRAIQTAHIVRGRRPLAIQLTPSLRERNFGGFEGRSHQELRRVEEEHVALNDEEYLRFKPHPEFESDIEVYDRLLPFLDQVVHEYKGGTVLLATHYGIMRLLLHRLGAIARGEFPKIENSSYLHLSHDVNGYAIESTRGIDLPDRTLTLAVSDRRRCAA